MSSGHWLLQVLSTIGLISTLGVSMNAEAGLFGIGGNTMNWKEEVLLYDGQIIVAERFYNLGGYSTLESTERAALDQTVTFNLPGKGQKITWKTDFRDTEPEPNGLSLILFDVVKGVPYIATYPAGCIAYNKWQRPNPPQIFFKYENDQWKRIALAEFPTELTKANVIGGRPATKLLNPFYSVAQVKEENRYVNTPEYGTVLRAAVKRGAVGSSVNCIEMVPYGNGGWLGLDWFSDQPTYEACLRFCAAKGVSPQNCPCTALFKQLKGSASHSFWSNHATSPTH